MQNGKGFTLYTIDDRRWTYKDKLTYHHQDGVPFGVYDLGTEWSTDHHIAIDADVTQW